MPFGNLLKKLSKEKKIKYEELATMCNLSEDTIKKIANNKRTMTEENARKIAKALEVDEHLLVLEAYIDKAPKEILELLNKIREYTTLMGMFAIENEISKENYDIVANIMREESLSEYFADFFKNDNIEYINNKDFKISRDNLEFSISYDGNSFIEIKDNSMSPKIEKGDKITIYIKDKYINGEIIAAKVKGTEDILYRIVHFNNKEKTISLTPINTKEYKEITYNREDIEILGKVAKVITEI